MTYYMLLFLVIQLKLFQFSNYQMEQSLTDKVCLLLQWQKICNNLTADIKL
jgi:hypothetical protein